MILHHFLKKELKKWYLDNQKLINNMALEIRKL